jgi:hypothetical protein
MELTSAIKTRFTVVTWILICSVYLLIFVPPNLTGAHDPNMLAAFRDELPQYGTDEYSQFIVVMRMTGGGTSPKEFWGNVLLYRYYAYGYPFFLTSAAAILPIRLFHYLGDGTNSTVAYMLVLRQLSPLFMLAAIILLVSLWTGFRSIVKSIVLFAFLASIPAVFFNNMFWHPDSLVTLFVVLTIFALAKDELRFGLWFHLAAASCGLAAGTKVIGLFFFLSVGVYLLLGLTQHRVTLRGLLKHGATFVVVMIVTIVVSNPMLLIPNVARSYVETLRAIAEANAWGWDAEQPKGPIPWYADVLREEFGFWWTYVAVLVACLLGIAYNREKRMLNIIILTWILPISLYALFGVAYKSAHYFIPIFLPLMSCVGNVLESDVLGRLKGPALVLASVSILLCGAQLVFYIPTNAKMYMTVLDRENRSQSLRFYRELNDTYLSRQTEHTRLTVVREAKLYLPPSPNLDDTSSKYLVFDYDYINHVRPDLILLTKANIDRHSDPLQVRTAYPPARAQWVKGYDFYFDAKMDSLTGFHKVLETDFAVAFVRNK